MSFGNILLIAVIVESIAAFAFMGFQGNRLLTVTRKLSAETTQLAQENQKLDAVLSLQEQIQQDTKALADQEAAGKRIATDKDLVVFVDNLDRMARASGLEWSDLAYKGFTDAAAPSGYPPNLKVATFLLSAKGTWTQFLAFVDMLEQYPGIVSLGEPIDFPFLGNTGKAEAVTIPIKFYLSSSNDPSWMIQKNVKTGSN
jgi:hypothetical protein